MICPDASNVKLLSIVINRIPLSDEISEILSLPICNFYREAAEEWKLNCNLTINGNRDVLQVFGGKSCMVKIRVTQKLHAKKDKVVEELQLSWKTSFPFVYTNILHYNTLCTHTSKKKHPENPKA